jgi:predicted DNA-binding transcriptional regulator AlpA
MTVRLLKAEEVRDRLGLRSVHSIYRWTRNGTLPAIVLSKRAIRYREEDVDAFIAEHRTEGEQA